MNIQKNDDTAVDTPRSMGRVMAWLAALALIGVLWLFFDGVLKRQDNPNRGIQTLPGAAAELVLKRNHSGHYVAPGTINGQPVTFMLDTGATLVSVPARLGDELGLEKGSSSQSSTANGYVTVHQTVIDELGIGPFVLRQIRAHLNPGMNHDDQVLLGMSVLKQLEFTQRGDTLVLRAPKPEPEPFSQ
jgi:aspartyl protease family protein